MEQYVRISSGWTRGGATITDRSFLLLDNLKSDKDGMYITVDSDGGADLRAGRNRIYMEGIHCYQPTTKHAGPQMVLPAVAKTDEEIAHDQRETFEILGEMTKAVASNTVKGLVVSGPAGIGKSHTVETTLHDTLDMLGKLTGQGQMYEVISGGISAAVLYEKLWEYRDESQVLVFDDCDGVLYDEDSLNVLKAALDSKKTRRISWNTRSLHLERKDIPNSFEYKGGVIFITNVKFDQIKSARIGNHLEAIVSRCHYMDIGIDTAREKLLHIRNVVERSNMLGSYGFDENTKAEVMDYINAHSKQLRELSLRMVLKIADLRKAMPSNWQRFVEKNCHRKAA
jgi:hypothetical protein